jgi:hypothetical protein
MNINLKVIEEAKGASALFGITANVDKHKFSTQSIQQ